MQPNDGSSPSPAPDETRQRDIWTARPGEPEAPADVHASERKAAAKARKGKEAGEWERATLEKLAFASLREQRRARRWRIFFTLLVFGYIGFLTWTLLSSAAVSTPASGPHTAVVRVHGTIAQDSEASVRYLMRSLKEAFESSQSSAVVLDINSPGGSPVQAGILHDEILRLKAKHNKPVHAVIGDVGASAAYYIAVAADQIHVDKASLVGSIGVLLNGFGFTGTMDKLGVERRLITAGEHKGFMDPFSPLNPSDVAHAQRMLRQIHDQFVAVVREGRGDRLKETPDMFSGLVWSGEEAVALGLADHLGSVQSVARDVVGQETVVDYTRRRGLAEQLSNRLGSALGLGVGQGLLQQAHEDGMAWR